MPASGYLGRLRSAFINRCLHVPGIDAALGWPILAGGGRRSADSGRIWLRRRVHGPGVAAPSVAKTRLRKWAGVTRDWIPSLRTGKFWPNEWRKRGITGSM